MKVIFVSLVLFVVAHAFPSEQDNYHKSSNSSKLNSDINVHQDWESKLKILFNGAKDYFGNEFENKDKEGSHDKNEHDNDKPSESKGKEDSHDKDENNKGNEDLESKLENLFNEFKDHFSSKHENQEREDPHGKNESDNANSSENKDKENSHDKDENNKAN